MRKCPEVGLGAMTNPLRVFKSEIVIHRLAELLLAAKVALRSFNRDVSK